ncbi:MAG: rhomboid family intramembrane serine protease [Hyphomicrobiales bacterium]
MTVRRAGSRRDAETYALVLTAAGIPCALVDELPGYSLRVDPAHAAKAFAEIAAYDRENPAVKPGEVAKPSTKPKTPVKVEGVMLAVTTLLFFFAAARNEAFGFDWTEKGAALTSAILNGEVWRAVTALTLHADGQHILSNLLFGTVVTLLLAQVTGAGVALLAMIVAATAGNLVNAALTAPGHATIGASTAIFAGLGLLTALRQDWRRDSWREGWRVFVPLSGGIMLLAMTGFSNDGRTDIMAHVLGFAAGLAGGYALSRVEHDWPADTRLQWLTGITAAWLVTAAWVIALTV